MKKPAILISTDYYLPGYQAGGSLRSLSNMVNALGKEFDFWIVTRDRDLGSSTKYAGVENDIWINLNGARVMYTNSILPLTWLRICRSISYDLLYLNSYFSTRFTIQPLLLMRLGLISSKPVILAPRGEFSEGALSQKAIKKRLFHNLAQMIGLYQQPPFYWQASNLQESEWIRSVYGLQVDVSIAADLPNIALDDSMDVQHSSKDVNVLKVLFVGRLARVKNLHWAISMFKNIRGRLFMSIYGLLEDEKYWNECRQLISELPSNITVEYFSPIPSDSIASVMKKHDLLIVPSLGENYSHVVAEALVVGTPVLASDRIPWSELESRGAGWLRPIEDNRYFLEILNMLIDLDETAYSLIRKNAYSYGRNILLDDSAKKQNRQLFYRAIGQGFINEDTHC